MSNKIPTSGYINETISYQHLLYSPLKKQGFLPGSGSEVFVRQVPVTDTEYDLLRFFSTVGQVFQVRLMMSEDQKMNRGFAYITYFEPSDAKKAVATLNSEPYRNRKFLTVENSLNNCRLFIGGIPTHMRKDQVWHELQSRGVKNFIDVIMYRSYSNRAENRGFVFVEFTSHEEAAYMRAKFGKTLRLWNNPVVVDWSVPIPEVDESIMNTVKIIYLRNLDVCQTREELQDIVLNFTPKITVVKVYKHKNYAFIHLISRDHAERLMEQLQDYYKDTLVEVTWAKPPSKFTTPDYRHNKVSYLASNCSRASPERSSNASFCSNCGERLWDFDPSRMARGIPNNYRYNNYSPRRRNSPLFGPSDTDFGVFSVDTNSFGNSNRELSHHYDVNFENLGTPFSLMDNLQDLSISGMSSTFESCSSALTSPMPIRQRSSNSQLDATLTNDLSISGISSSFELDATIENEGNYDNFYNELLAQNLGRSTRQIFSQERLSVSPSNSTYFLEVEILDVSQRNMERINSESEDYFSHSPNNNISFEDLEFIPSEIDIEDIHDFIGDLI